MDLVIAEDVAWLVNSRALDPNTLKVHGSKYLLGKLPGYLHPQRGLLATTTEAVIIPPSYSGFIGLRSTWARLGLLTPPTIADPGFEGTLTLELYNGSPNPVLIRPSDSIWHMVLVSTPFEPMYRGRYQHQSGLTLPKE